MGESIWSLLGMLSVAVAILLLAYWTTRWLAAGGGGAFRSGVREGAAAGSGSFRIAGQCSLGRNERLVLLRFPETWCLLGVTEHTITVLREWKAEEDWDAETAAPPAFLEVLRRNLKKGRET